MAKITATFEVPDKELWSCVFGSAFDTWGWWGADFLEGSDWDTPGRVRMYLWDPEDPDATEAMASKVVDVELLANALSQPQFSHLAARWDDLDAEDADCLLQYLVAGEVIFG